jgi:hypothetical protein
MKTQKQPIDAHNMQKGRFYFFDDKTHASWFDGEVKVGELFLLLKMEKCNIVPGIVVGKVSCLNAKGQLFKTAIVFGLMVHEYTE